jgi:hypothetical protein
VAIELELNERKERNKVVAIQVELQDKRKKDQVIVELEFEKRRDRDQGRRKEKGMNQGVIKETKVVAT